MTEQERQLLQMLRDDAGPIRPNRFLDAADVIERLAAEVERLRAGGCARDQRTTQYCAEAVRLQAELERLRGELVSTTNKLTEERDEARQWVCIMKAQSVTYAYPPEHFARKHGWDCFKEASK